MDYLNPLGGDPIEELLASLEAQLPLLPEAAQEFVNGCRVNISSGFALDEMSKQKLRNLAEHLAKVAHNALDSGQQTGPTPIDMLRNLANVRYTLSPQEQVFANTLAAKLQRNIAITPNEKLRLSNMHKAKGF